jgi:hypothetical protein
MRRLWLLTVVALSLVSAAHAQGNLLLNARFDTDLSGWQNLFDRPVVWSEEDASGFSASGSALITNVGPSNGGWPWTLHQCVPAEGQTDYHFGGQALIPPGQAENVQARILIYSFASSDCSGDPLQIENEAGARVAAWGSIGAGFTSASTARGLIMMLAVSKPEGVSADASAYFDNLFLRRANGTGTRAIDEHLAGSWYNPMTNGQGFFLDISPAINLFFGGWFTWTDVPGQYDWMTVQGSYVEDFALVTIYRTSGGAFNDPTAVTTVPVGVAEFRFQSCTAGEVSIQFLGPDPAFVIPLQRIAPPPGGCVE